MMGKVTLGSRSSDLALAQSCLVASRLEAAWPGLSIEIRTFKTTGDVRLDLDLRELASGEAGSLDKGLFTRELEVALLDHQIDLAVHSLKDLPTRLPNGLVVGAVLEREDASDLLVTLEPGGLDSLPVGARVATGSERRRLQLLAARPDLRLTGLRGNVPTRLRKLAEGKAGQAIVLAAAGLKRLGHPSTGQLEFDGHRLYLSSLREVVLPAVGQGIIGVECRARDQRIQPLLRAIHHAPTWCQARAERALLRTLGGGCQMPLGVSTMIDRASPSSLQMRAVLFRDAQPESCVEAVVSGSTRAPVELARLLAHRLSVSQPAEEGSVVH